MLMPSAIQGCDMLSRLVTGASHEQILITATHWRYWMECREWFKRTAICD